MRWIPPLLMCGAAAFASTHRFLLVAGANEGGPGKAQLKYARSDARNFRLLLMAFGGVDSGSVVALDEPDSSGLLRGIDSLARLVRSVHERGMRTETILYYSGHADGNGLRLGPGHVGYRQLREAMDSIGSDVLLAVLDACASGSALRSKGGVIRPAFLVDESREMRGRALLTSSSALEDSHESDSLGGSIFTQALLAGLRGAADADGDARITLNEVYRYSYQETLRNTQTSGSGTQHPSVDMDMTGAGDMVLTDLRAPAAQLRLDSSVAGVLNLRDSSGATVVEFRKRVGTELRLGLEPGTYRARFTNATRAVHAELHVAIGDVVVWGDSLLRTWDPCPAPASPGSDALRTVKFNLGFMPPIDLAGEDGLHSRQNFALELAVAEAAEIRGLQMAAGMATVRGRMRGAQLAVGAVFADGDSTVGFQGAIMTISRGAARGAQAGLISVARSGLTGLQASSIANLSGRGDFTGAQIAAVFNIAERGGGLQIAPANWGGRWLGAQIGVVNGSVSSRGAQLGLVNGAGAHDGLQLGVVSLADSVAGLQCGVVALSRHTRGLPLGLLTWSGDLPWRLDSWVDETGLPTVASVWEWKWLHSQSEFLSDLESRDRPVFGYGVAVGVQLPSRRWILSADLGFRSITRFETRSRWTFDRLGLEPFYSNEQFRLRAVVGAWIVPRRLGLFAGTGWTVQSMAQARGDEALLVSRIGPEQRLTASLRGWPAVSAGVRLGLRGP